MQTTETSTALSRPRWDGSRVVFEIDADGTQVRCAISRAALQDLNGRRHFAAAELLRCFMVARTRIEAIAAAKFLARPDNAAGIISIWADDIDDPPSAPAVARQMPPVAKTEFA